MGGFRDRGGQDHVAEKTSSQGVFYFSEAYGIIAPVKQDTN